jgi:hypothetical protein
MKMRPQFAPVLGFFYANSCIRKPAIVVSGLPSGFAIKDQAPNATDRAKPPGVIQLRGSAVNLT